MKKEKKEKKINIPKLFTKKYSEKKLKKKILKRIHIPKDREMVRELFVPSEKAGNLELKQEIPRDILVRLAPLAKSIKKNKGAVTRWKAAILIVIIGTGVVFNFFFKDRMIKQLLEKGLETVFEAESTVEKPKLSLVEGIFSYESLQIADAGNLSKNLIETGPAVFRISIPELTRKRIHIEETSLTGVRWDTERMVDGEPFQPDQTGEKDGDKSKGSVLDVLALTPEEMDYRALLESQKENLKSLNLINSGNEQIEEFSERWKGIYNEKEKEILSLTKEVKSLQSIRLEDIRSIEDGKAAIARVEALYPGIEETTDSLKGLQKQFNAEKKNLTGLYDEVQGMMEDDIDYLKGLVDFSGGDIRSLASNAAERYIRTRWNDYYEKGLKALDVYEKLKGKQQEMADAAEEKKKDEPRREGRIIPFPSPDLPTVLVKQILLSGGTDDTGILKTEVRSVTDAPDKIDDPTTFLTDWQQGASSISLDGTVDGKSGAEQFFTMNIVSPGNSLKMDDGIPALQVDTLKSKAAITGKSYTLQSQDALMTELDILLTSIEIEQSSNGFIAEAVMGIMNEIDRVELEADVLVSRKGIEKIDVRTDLDNILADKIGDYLKDLADKVEEELREYLLDFLKPYLEDNEALQKVMETLGVESLEQLTSMEGLRGILDEKKKELTNQADAILAEVDRLKAEAERLAREEAAKLKAEADRLKAEAEAEAARLQAEAEAEAARRQAEVEAAAQKAAEEAAKEVTDKVKLPGF